MEAIDRRGQCNFFQQGDKEGGKASHSNLSWHGKKQKTELREGGGRILLSDSLISLPANNNPTLHTPAPIVTDWIRGHGVVEPVLVPAF